MERFWCFCSLVCFLRRLLRMHNLCIIRDFFCIIDTTLSVTPREFWAFLGIMLVAWIEGIPGGNLWKNNGRTEGYRNLFWKWSMSAQYSKSCAQLSLLVKRASKQATERKSEGFSNRFWLWVIRVLYVVSSKYLVKSTIPHRYRLELPLFRKMPTISESIFLNNTSGF